MKGSFLVRLAAIAAICLNSVAGFAQDFRDEIFTYMQYYDDADGSRTVLLFGMCGCPSDGVLRVPANITAGGENYRVVGMDARFYFREEYKGKCEKMILPETFRELGPNVDGSRNPYVLQQFADKGLKSIEISAANPWFKMQDGFMLSSDGKNMYYLTDEVAANPVMTVPEGVEQIYFDQLSYYEKYGDNLEYITLPSTLKASCPIYYGYRTIIMKSATAPEPLNRAGNYNNRVSEIFVPKGSLESYRYSSVWGYSSSCGRLHETDMNKDKTVTLDLKFYDSPQPQVYVNGKLVSSTETITLPALEKFSLRITGRDGLGYFNDSSHPDASYEADSDNSEVTYAFYPFENTLLRAGDTQYFGNDVFLIRTTYDGISIMDYFGSDTEAPEIPSTISTDTGTYDVTELEDGLFSGRRFTRIELPSTIRRIGAGCFSDGNLADISLPEGLERIDFGAFSNQKNLRDIILPSSLRWLAENAFSGCDLRSINLPAGIATIETTLLDQAGGDDGLVDLITIDAGPDPLRANIYPARRIVVNRPWLPDIIAARELEFRGDRIIVDLDAISRGGRDMTEKITVRGGECTLSGRLGSSLLTKDNVSYFYKDKKNILKEINVECSSLSMGNGALADSRALTSVKIECADVPEIGDSSFECCTSLSDIALSGVKGGFGPAVFRNCSGLNTIAVDGGVDFINSVTFDGCTSLKRVEFGSGSTPLFIGTGAFDACPVEEVALDRDITDPEPTFFRCETLRRLEIGANVTHIPNFAFGDCRNLSEIYCSTSTPPSIEENTFRNVPTDRCTVYVKGDDGEYRQAGGWKEFFPVGSVDAAEISRISVKSTGDALTIEGAEGKPVAVYSVSGVRPFYKDDASCRESVNLAPGLYIVVAGTETFKINHK